MSKLRRILSWLALAVCFAVLCVFLWRNVTDLLDSDMASDMIYADLLRQEGSLLSSNWYYSSEIRILSNHLFFTPLFYLTRDWHLVRFLGTALSYVLLLLSLWTVTRQVGLRRWFPLIGAALLLPLSIAYTHYSLVGTFYMPHHILAFFLFALTLSQSAPCTPPRPRAAAGGSLGPLRGGGAMRLSLPVPVFPSDGDGRRVPAHAARPRCARCPAAERLPPVAGHGAGGTGPQPLCPRPPLFL